MKAIVVDCEISGERANLKEMENLLHTLDVDMDFVCSQKLDKPHTATYIGKGLLNELASYIMQNDVDIVVFNNDLSPLQIKNITEACGVDVFDRSMIILKIFEMRASSKEAKLQVEIAYLKYMASRLIEKDKNYEQVTSGGAGGVTNRGAGEKAIAIKRYLFRKRIKQKEEELEEIASRRIEKRNSSRKMYPRVAIVGYTNAGKSTLMNNFIRMTDTNKRVEVLEENRLFATLSTNTRLIKIDKHYPFLFTDTVGFISSLPTPLIKAFRSTLEEINDADLLIHVIDISDPNFIDQIKVTNETLREIGINKDIPMIFLLNKIDKISMTNVPFVDDKALLVSLKGEDYMDSVLSLIDENISKFYVELSLFIPYENANVFFEIKNNEAIVEYEENDEGYKCVAKISYNNVSKYREYLALLNNKSKISNKMN